MKIVIPCLNEYDLSAKSHTTITTDSSQVICLEKTEDGGWLNGRWNGRGVYQYIVVMNGGINRYITEETYEELEKLLYGE